MEGADGDRRRDGPGAKGWGSPGGVGRPLPSGFGSPVEALGAHGELYPLYGAGGGVSGSAVLVFGALLLSAMFWGICGVIEPQPGLG